MMLRRVVLVLTALVAVGATAAPAVAETEVHRDPRGDVRHIEARGARTSADVIRLTGDHAGPSLTVAVDLVDLVPGTAAYLGVDLRTTRGGDYDVVSYRARGEKYLELTKTTRQGGATVDCPGLRGTFQNERDRAVVVVPRSCINRPRWVRYGALAAAERGVERTYADDARSDGRRTSNLGPVLGNRLRHA